jgi:RNase H-like domain found in reverse transcriptase
VYAPTRVLRGTLNAVAHFQSEIQQIIAPLSKNRLQYLDDILMHCSNEEELLVSLKSLLGIFQTHGLKLNPKICVLFALTVQWCCRIISKDGVLSDPRRVQGLHDMALPCTGDDLQQFCCSLNWMRTSIPRFAEQIFPLTPLLDVVYANASKRNKSACAKINLFEVGWGAAHTTCFPDCQNALAKAVTLAHPDSSQRLCVNSDASELFWASVATCVPLEDLDLPIAEQRHKSLSFLSGKFNGASGRWPIIEKETYAILPT